MQAGTAALLTCACPWGQPHAARPCGCSTHVAEEAELVVLPAKAPVIRSWRPALLAPAKAAEPLVQHPACPSTSGMAPQPHRLPGGRKISGPLTSRAKRGP